MELSLSSSLNLYITVLVFSIYSFLGDSQREIGVDISPPAIPTPSPPLNGIARQPPPPLPRNAVESGLSPPRSPPESGTEKVQPLSPPPPLRPQRPLKDGFNAGKIVGMSFAGIAGILQVWVVGFLVFRRKQLVKFRDRSTQS